jgi:hypothetical protein
MCELIFSQQRNPQTLRYYLRAVIGLLCFPDGICVKKGITIAEFLLKIAVNDTRLVNILGKDLFSTALSILLAGVG